MKKLILLLLAACAMLAVASCVKFDDSDIQDEISNIKSRLTALEETVNAMNGNITTLQGLVNAINGKVTIESVTETDGGWIIKFSDGKTATISNGAAGSGPVVGVKKDSDGIYYWTLNGSWLLDENGKKLPVSGVDGAQGEPGADAIAPQLTIKDGWWYISTDDGKTWEKLDKATGDNGADGAPGKNGEDGDSFFKSVTWDDSFFYITLADGTTLRIGRGSGGALAISAVPDYADGSVQAVKEEFTIRFDVYPEAAADELAALSTSLFKLKVVYTYPTTKASAGQSVTLPILSKEGLNGVLILTVDGSGLADEFIAGTIGANASLSVVYMENGMTSGYFPLKFFDSLNGHSYVDLGLPSGTKWADMNVGADNPEDPGDYFAWGEIEPYYEPGHALDDPCTAWKPGKEAGYDWPSYRWCEGADNTLTKYNDDPAVGNVVDHKIILDPEDDAATAKWGGYWRMPTRAELDELLYSCTWKETTRNGVNGYVATPKKGGQELFFPFHGFRNDTRLGKNCLYVWSSTRRLTELTLPWPKQEMGDCLIRNEDGQFGSGSSRRYMGLTIRPVYGKLAPVQTIEVTPSTIHLSVGEKATLTATIVPSKATEPTILWESKDESVATVDENGNVTAVADGITYIVAWSSNGLSSSCAVTVGDGPAAAEPEYVDLGLSVKWATFNVGARKPEEKGDLFAWGEIEPYYEPGTVDNPVWKPGKEAGYDWPSYKWCKGSNKTLTKYNVQTEYGSVDNLCILEPEDDAATVKWGDLWRMPTYSELVELHLNCTFESSELNGVKGLRVTSKVPGYEEKSIFLPANQKSGSKLYCNYWGSVTGESSPTAAMIGNGGGLGIVDRINGYGIRPVYGPLVPLQSVSFEPVEMSVGEELSPIPTFVPANASETDLRSWESSDSDVASVTYYGKITAISEGTATITARTCNNLTATCTVTVKAAEPVEPEYVDLGLSVKWATFNLGAPKTEEHGDYFAWGETEPRESYLYSHYGWESYKWANDNHDMTKYCPVDGKFILDPEDDAATAVWGDPWRMPTLTETEELIENCEWTYDTVNDVNGLRGTSKIPGYTEKSIFFPFYGMSNYIWINGLSHYYDSHACGFRFGYNFFQEVEEEIDERERYRGYEIRPVYGKLVPVTSLSITPAIELSVGESVHIPATVQPSNASEPSVRWIVHDNSVVTLEDDDSIMARSEGTTTVTAYASSGITATCTVTVKNKVEGGPEAVDLGLSVKWASYNLGASKPEEPGDYYAWGETRTYYEPGYAISDYPVWLYGKEAGYDWPSYRLCDGSGETINKYCTESYYGKVDGKTLLEQDDDAATAGWGSPWRMPSKNEMEELLNPENCSWKWTTENGMAGYRVTSLKDGHTGESIFLPAAGYRYELTIQDVGDMAQYWTRTLVTDYPNRAWARNFYEDSHLDDIESNWFDMDRCYGLSIRPVCK